MEAINMYEKLIDILGSEINLEVSEDQIKMECLDRWRDVTVMTLSIEDAKRLRNYLTEAINFATLNKEE
jgi:hypothetical protein